MTAIAGANIKLGGDESGFISSLTNARAKLSLFTREINSNVTQAYKSADASQRAFRGGLSRLGDEVTSLGQKMALVGTLPALFAAGKAYKDYADIQRMEKGLALYGSTLEDIRRLAKEPNIGVFDGAKSLIGLRAAKVEAGLAERAVKSFANAIAAAGGNATDLEPALLNLKQFKATRNINQVDLRQLSARIPQSSDAIQKAFGTLDPEKLNKIGIDKFIEGFVSELEKIPKVAGGAGVAMEQVADSFTFFSAMVGEGIEKAFNVSDKINALGGFLDNLATNFKSLTPEAQKAILMIGGMAVAIPALTIAVGGLIKFIPLIATGFGAISWPVVAIVATGAAIAAVLALLPLLTNNVADLNKQQAEVSGFTTKLNPLLDQYDALKAKTGLTSEEQGKLKDITKQIADLVPTAVSGWDKYGNAIDINTAKAKLYITEQQKLLAAMQNTRREALLLETTNNSKRRTELQGMLGSGTQTTRVNLGMGQYQDQVHTLSAAEVRRAGKELGEIQQKDLQNRKELLNIGGLEAYQKDVIELRLLIKKREDLKKEYTEALKGKDFPLQEDIRIESDSVGEQIKAKGERIGALGPQMIQARRELRADNAIVKPKETTTPDPKKDSPFYVDNDAHKEYLKLLRDEKANLEAIRDIARDIKAIDGSGTSKGHSLNAFSNDLEFQKSLAGKKAADSFKKQKGDIADIAALGAPKSGKDSIQESMDRSLEAYKKKVEDAKNVTDDLNKALSSAFKDTAGSIAVGFGEMLGDLASGVGGVEAFGQKLVGALGSMLKEMGKALIAAGLAGIALKQLFKVPALAVAAGVALTAVGQVLGNSMKSSVNKTTSTRFAKGGFAYGEMNAIVGDNPNSRNDPEMIAPYSKVHDSIRRSINESGSEGGNVFIPEIKLRGEDMYVQFKRVEKRNKALGIA